MIPISEFPIALCGIATVAASLGYACARRAVLSLASPSSKADVEAGQSEERSLKRKLDDAGGHDVDAEHQSRPMKRNRTPPTRQHEADTDIKSTQQRQVNVTPTLCKQAVSLPQPEEPVQDNNSNPKEDPRSIEHDISLVQQPTSPAHPETLSQSEEKGVKAGRCSTPQPSQVNPASNEPETLPPRPITPPEPVVPTKIEPAKAFSTFSGSSSPFGSYSNSSGVSPFALSGQIVRATPAWRHDNENESVVFCRATPTNALAPSPNDAVSSITTKSPGLSQRKDVLGSLTETQSLAKSPGYVTGEEGEHVDAELKGVKLFVKRGRKEFIDGMYGHMKILSEKPTAQKIGDEDPQRTETEASSRTRLLFRRDPLGQVSMNIGLHPTVRCHFDSAENILRVIVVEQATVDGKDPKEDVVIYALKPGRSQKADFQSFAKTLCDHDGLKSGLITSLAASTSGDAAAS